MNQGPKNLRVIFMGTSAFAEEILASLIAAGYPIISAYTQAPKKVGRSHKLQKSRVHFLSEKNKIEVFTPYKFDEVVIQEIKKQNPDLIIVAAYGKILPEAVLKIPRFGCLNVHASLLPKFRGPSPIQNVILAGEKETGITLIQMDKGVDTGEIISQQKTKIEKKETAAKLSERLAKIGSQLLMDTLPKWVSGKLKSKPQNNSLATLCQLIEREDGHIFWNEDAKIIFNKFRALQPWPGIFTFWKKNGQLLRLKLTDITLSTKKENQGLMGEIIQLSGQILVRTGNGYIQLKKVQLEGKPEMAIQDFINGQKKFIGSILS